MRAFVVAEDGERRAALTAALELATGQPTAAAAPEAVTEALRRLPAAPDALLVAVDGPEDATTLARLLERARLAAEASLPALLLLPGGSTWLRSALPPALQPAAAIAQQLADGETIARALAALVAPAVSSVTTAGAGRAAPRWQLDAVLRRFAGPDGETSLTASEHALLARLIADPGAVVPAAEIARALWDAEVLDRYARAAMRSHVHTLRRKLRAVGLDGAVQSIPGVGYRFVNGGSG